MKKFRVAVITDKGDVISENFNSRDKATAWLLKLIDKEGVKYYKIINRETKELLETENKQYDKGERNGKNNER